MSITTSYTTAINSQDYDLNQILAMSEGTDPIAYNRQAIATVGQESFKMTAETIADFVKANPLKFADLTDAKRSLALRDATAIKNLLDDIAVKNSNSKKDKAREIKKVNKLVTREHSQKIQVLASEIKNEDEAAINFLKQDRQEINRVRIKAEAVISVLKPVETKSYCVIQ